MVFDQWIKKGGDSMGKRLKYLSFILILSALLILLCACNGGNGSDTTDTIESDAPAKELLVAGDGSAARIVISADASEDLRSGAESIAKRIEKNTGIKAQVEASWETESEEHDPEAVEILIGNTGYIESKKALQSLRYDEYGVVCYGNKIVVASYSETKLKRGITILVAWLNEYTSEDGTRISIPAGSREVASVSSVAKQLPMYENAIPTALAQVSNNVYELLFDDFTEADYTAYTARIGEEGYQRYTENRIDNNVFTTYTKGNYILTAMWTPNNDQMRLIIEDNTLTSLPKLESENVYRKEVCSTLFTQVGLNYQQGYLEGICDIMRLEDGSFIIVDGGHPLQENADRIYNVMKEQAPDPNNIVVAAWVFSHGHGDHVGFFKQFADTYSDKVTVEQFIYNSPVEEICSVIEEGSAEWKKVENALAVRFADSALVRAHPGQVFNIRNAKLTVLYTHDLYAPKDISWYNTTSLVFTIEADGVKAFLPTDAGEAIARVMLSLYSNTTFASDILQVAHHGIPSTATQLYPKVDPTYVLWPVGTGDISRRKDENGNYTSRDCVYYLQQSYNAFLFNSAKCKNNVFVANDDMYVLEYHDGEVTVHFYENDADYFARNND